MEKLYKSVLLYLHLKNYDFSISFCLPLHQGCTLSLPNVVYLFSLFSNCIKKAVMSVHLSWSIGFKKP